MSAMKNQQYIWNHLLLLLLFTSAICTAPALENEPGLEIRKNVYNEANPDDIDVQIDYDDNSRSAVKSPYQLWPTKDLSYKISSDYTDEEAENVREALRYFNEETCLKFSEFDDTRDAGKRYFNYKKSKNKCGTLEGYNRQKPSGPQDIVMNPYCLARRDVIQHETMRVLGLYHEQRDYVTSKPLGYYLMNYIMSTSKHGQIVEREMGQAKGPSESDLTKLRKMYKCGFDGIRYI